MISKLLNPKSIAVIGASDNPQKVGYALMKNLKNFKGIVIPINPKIKYKTVLGYKQSIDLAIIAIPAPFVKKALEQCGKKKIQNVIIISAGFSEQGNKKQEQELVDIANKYKIRILGPNCFGITNPYLNLDTTFSKSNVKKGNIAFISQSGALWSYISDIAKSKEIGFSGFVSVGNMSDLNFADLLEYFSKDNKTKSIILYIEKLKQGKKFLEIAKKSKKPIYAIKAGKSKEGAQAAISHTGSLATDYEVYKGAFKQANIILCDSLEQAIEKASKKKINTQNIKLKPITQATIITNAGGAGALAADYLSENNIKINGPYDILGTATSKDYERALNEHKKSQTIITLLTNQTMSDPIETAKKVIEYKKQNKSQTIITCFLGATSVDKSNKLLRDNKIINFQTLEGLRKKSLICCNPRVLS